MSGAVRSAAPADGRSPREAPAGAVVGYVRVSTGAQTTDTQLDTVAAAGATRTFTDTMSGARADRPGMAALLDYVRPGDTVVVAGFDRFGRSTAQAFTTMADLLARGIHLRGLREGVDTSTIHGRMVAGLFLVIAEWERELIAERAAVARQAAHDRGKHTGRPPKLTRVQRDQLRTLHAAGTSVPDLCSAYGVGRSTVYRIVQSTET